MSYQNPNFDREEYWKNKGKKKVKEQPRVVSLGAPLMIEGDKVVSKNRAQIRRERKGRDYTFYRRKGYLDNLGAIKIKRVKNGKPKYKLIPVTIDKP